MAVPNEDGTSYTREVISVEYEWQPPREVDQTMGHATVSKHTSPTWNEGFESDDEVDEVIFPKGNKFDDQFDIRLKGRVRT
ncbi:hypothetical protein Tco_1413820 [Tanacetum coccineum]